MQLGARCQLRCHGVPLIRFNFFGRIRGLRLETLSLAATRALSFARRSAFSIMFTVEIGEALCFLLNSSKSTGKGRGQNQGSCSPALDSIFIWRATPDPRKTLAMRAVSLPYFHGIDRSRARYAQLYAQHIGVLDRDKI